MLAFFFLQSVQTGRSLAVKINIISFSGFVHPYNIWLSDFILRIKNDKELDLLI